MELKKSPEEIFDYTQEKDVSTRNKETQDIALYDLISSRLYRQVVHVCTTCWITSDFNKEYLSFLHFLSILYVLLHIKKGCIFLNGP